MKYSVISFYRYTNIDNPEVLRDSLTKYCQDHQILGRILLGTEGINGAVSSTLDEITKFKSFLQEHFPGLTFREQDAEHHTYHKLVVRIREEICAFGAKVDVKNTGTHLTPEELQKLYEQGEDFVIIDARNDYEFDVGHFEGARKLPIKTFREFPKAVEDLEDLKNKKVVLYCTGGIRCEKASAYMKEQGFKDVNQLDGGIINYVNQFPDNKWKGGLFVFDDRLVSKVGQAVTKCTHCQKPESAVTNCHNQDCDRFFVICASCQKTMDSSCSEACKNAPRRRAEVTTPEVQVGVVKKYYAKSHVAEVVLSKPLEDGETVHIKGKTTDFSQTLTNIKVHPGNEVTFVVKDRVRENDKILVA